MARHGKTERDKTQEGRARQHTTRQIMPSHTKKLRQKLCGRRLTKQQPGASFILNLMTLIIPNERVDQKAMLLF